MNKQYTQLPQVKIPEPEKPSYFTRHHMWGYAFLFLSFLLVVALVYQMKYRVEEQPRVCIQVIATARNNQTGEVRDFPTPCDVPAGWTAVSPGESTKQQTMANGHVTFNYPDKFTIAKFQTTGSDVAFKDYVVLVETRLLGGWYSGQEIPIGQVSTIMLNLNDASKSSFLKRSYIEGTMLASHRRSYESNLKYKVTELIDGYQGPYGENAYYYLVEFPDGLVLEVISYRNIFGAGQLGDEPSNYNKDMEFIIDSIIYNG
jgi:hypothetical protein